MSPLDEALALLEHASKGNGNIELDEAQATALVVDREAMWNLCKQLKVEVARAAEEERERCSQVALDDLLAQPELVAAEHRFDNGASERAARRIAEAILFRVKP